MRGEIKRDGAIFTFIGVAGSLGGGCRAEPTCPESPGQAAACAGRAGAQGARGVRGARLRSPDAPWACRWGGDLDPAVLGSPATWVPELDPTPGPGAVSRAD